MIASDNAEKNNIRRSGRRNNSILTRSATTLSTVNSSLSVTSTVASDTFIASTPAPTTPVRPKKHKNKKLMEEAQMMQEAEQYSSSFSTHSLQANTSVRSTRSRSLAASTITSTDTAATSTAASPVHPTAAVRPKKQKKIAKIKSHNEMDETQLMQEAEQYSHSSFAAPGATAAVDYQSFSEHQINASIQSGSTASSIAYEQPAGATLPPVTDSAFSLFQQQQQQQFQRLEQQQLQLQAQMQQFQDQLLQQMQSTVGVAAGGVMPSGLLKPMSHPMLPSAPEATPVGQYRHTDTAAHTIPIQNSTSSTQQGAEDQLLATGMQGLGIRDSILSPHRATTSVPASHSTPGVKANSSTSALHMSKATPNSDKGPTEATTVEKFVNTANALIKIYDVLHHNTILDSGVDLHAALGTNVWDEQTAKDTLYIRDCRARTKLIFSHNDLQLRGESDYQSNVLTPLTEDGVDFYPCSDANAAFLFKNHENWTRSAKVDLISAHLPCFIEIKTDDKRKTVTERKQMIDSITKEVVIQGVERLDALARVNGTIGEAFVFAATGRGTYLIHFVRYTPEKVKNTGKSGALNFYYLGCNDALFHSVWHGLVNKSVREVQHDWCPFWLTRDAPMVLRILSEMHLPHALCRIKLVGCSSNAVYGITLMDNNNIIQKRVVHFCIKVIGDENWCPQKGFSEEDLTEQEVRLSGTIATAAHNEKRPCYLWAGFTASSEKIEWWIRTPADIDEAARMLTAIKIKGRDCAWWKLVPTRDTRSSGALIMQAGHYNHKITFAELPKLMLEVSECLSFYHRQGILHRDIRLPNVVKFGESFQLIDFGLAVPQNANSRNITLTQLRNCGKSVLRRALSAGLVNTSNNQLEYIGGGKYEEVLFDDQWSADDDHEMFAAMVARFLSNSC